jgi:hypothetical protein
LGQNEKLGWDESSCSTLDAHQLLLCKLCWRPVDENTWPVVWLWLNNCFVSDLMPDWTRLVKRLKLLNSNRDIIQQADDTKQTWFYQEVVLDAQLLFGVLLMSSISDFDLHLEISYSWKVCQSFSRRLHNYYNLVVF